jgi:predicted  nucleic acid-binding Zn-ribbon protein
MGQTLSLFRLQQTDSQIDRLSSRLKTIQLKLEDDITLQRAKENLEEAEKHQHTTENELQAAETAVKNLRIKIEQTEASLYSGKGYSPKELQDMQNDVASMKRRLTQLEDDQLNAMIAVEQAENRLHDAQIQVNREKSSSMEQNKSLTEEQATLQKELQKLNLERAANSGSIPEKTLHVYDQLRQKRNGVAVAVISERACSACGSGLTPAQIQAARTSDQIALCPSCGRILYGN